MPKFSLLGTNQIKESRVASLLRPSLSRFATSLLSSCADRFGPLRLKRSFPKCTIQ